MQFVELLIDENPQALERPRRRMNFAGLGAHDLAHEIGERTRRRNRCVLPRGDNRTRHGARVTLFAENIDDVGEISFGRLGDHVGCGRTVLPHAHVERALAAKRKAATGFVQLHRGHADIHHDAIDRRRTLSGTNLREVGESILDQGKSAI